MVYSENRTITQLNEAAGASLDLNNDEIPVWRPSAAAGLRTQKIKIGALLARTSMSAISGLDAALSARLQVFGTPANGQIPVWNSTNTRAEWGAVSGGGGAVSSVFGRTGAVVAQASDYSSFYVQPNTAPILAASTEIAGSNIVRLNITSSTGTRNSGIALRTGNTARWVLASYQVGAEATDRFTFFNEQNGLGAFELLGDNSAVFSASIQAPQVRLPQLASAPATPSSGFALYADNTNRLSWRGSNGFIRSLDAAITANRSYTLPDQDGTISLLSDIRVTFVSVTASRSLLLSDQGLFLSCNSASAVTITVPTDATVNFPIGSFVEVAQEGSGQVTIAAASGANVRRFNSGATTGHNLAGQYTACVLKKVAANEWRMYGGVA